MKLLRSSISVKDFGANAHKFYVVNISVVLDSRKTYTTMQYQVLL